MQITDIENNNNLLKTLVIEVPAVLESTITNKLSEKTLEPIQRQLLILSQSLSIALTAIVSNNTSTLSSILGNQA